MTVPDLPSLRQPLLTWAQDNLRDLPWRRTRDPWAVLVSEVMLQQTQVERVIPKFVDFIERFPTTAACAGAAPAEVISQWSGLGYNRRAVLLHRAAGVIETEHEGHFPRTYDELLAIPGVGPYTARAVLAFAFEFDAAPVDTNVGRIIARIDGRTYGAKQVQARADELLAVGESWAWNQTLMDLGAAICLRRSPKCGACPARSQCRWQGRGSDPADGSAGTTSTQSRFVGSDREGRGKLISALARGPISNADASGVMGWPEDSERVTRVLDTLKADGLIEVQHDELFLLGAAPRRDRGRAAAERSSRERRSAACEDALDAN